MSINKKLINEIKETFNEAMYELQDIELATKKVLDDYSQELQDYDDKVCVLSGLAVAQWERGLLLPEIKDLATSELQTKLLESKTSNDAKAYAAYERLLNKITAPQPSLKKYGKRQQYICPWNIGDVFAYKIFNTDLGKNIYVYFIKVGTRLWWPRNIIPIVSFYNLFSEELLEIDRIVSFDYMIQFFNPTVYFNSPNKPKLYKLGLIINKQSDLKDKLYYIGNAVLVENENQDNKAEYNVEIEKLDLYIIDRIKKYDIIKVSK